jgi:predicted nucleic acid-binding Zn ribbon protein
MPKKPPADKKTRARIHPSKAGFRKAPASINDLLQRRPLFRELAARIPEQQSWSDWLRAVVPAELASHIVNVIPKGAELVILADSPAWCARLRYAAAALERQITERDAAMRRIRVRVSKV